MNRRQIYAVIISFFALLALVNAANAQSQDRDNPTQLISGKISGLIDSESIGKFYYYTFTANPGEITITLSVDSDPPIDANLANYKSVKFTLYDRNAATIASKTAMSSGSGTEQAVARVDITRRQTVILKIEISDAALFSVSKGRGKYRIRVDGAAELGQGDSTVSKNKSDTSESFLSFPTTKMRFPERGTLQISANDIATFVTALSSINSISISVPSTSQLKTSELNYGEINLPKKGYIIILMKDGSTISFNLSQLSSLSINK